ncbi:SPOR domain-containing protein [Photobacterium sanctipauli]|uniref:SPOR domain-containing protein n=2 Tax=Photobacterium sanctipauli TaxID=1342794 RepID=A0A2T3NZA2_9GAMM|nr:SPOR domain-containing protein [Photobacterium sanctipauli]
MASASPSIAAEPQTNVTGCTASSLPSGWQRLNSQCDTGTGLWGRDPQPHQSHFWLQCNYSQAIPARKFSNIVTQAFPSASYLIHDGKSYRCLIGPFDSVEQAKDAKVKLAAAKIEKTFIRQTKQPIAISSAGKTLQPILAAVENEQAQTKPSQRANAEPPKETLIENRTVLDSAIYSFTFDNIKYYQPKNIQSSKDMPPAFVKEHNQYWSRVSIQNAGQWCQRFGLRLPTYDELKHLQTYGQRFLLRNHWPVSNSYWSDTINSYTGEIKTLNLRNGHYDEYRPRALLYTTCVTEAS